MDAMAALAAVCGIAIILFGLLTAGRAPSDVRYGIEVTSFVGGLVLCFLAVVLGRLARTLRMLEARSRTSDDMHDI